MWIHLYSALCPFSHEIAWEFKWWKMVWHRPHIVNRGAFVPPDGKQWTSTPTNFVMRFVGNGNIYILTVSCFVWFVVAIRNMTIGMVRVMTADGAPFISSLTRRRIFDNELTRKSRWDREIEFLATMRTFCSRKIHFSCEFNWFERSNLPSVALFWFTPLEPNSIEISR